MDSTIPLRDLRSCSMTRSRCQPIRISTTLACPRCPLCRHGLRLTTVLNTHTHADHIGINRDLQARGLPASMRVVGPARAAADVPGLTEAVDEGEEVRSPALIHI